MNKRIRFQFLDFKMCFSVFFISFIILFGLLQWQQRFRLHPDEISYLEIARYYRNGNFTAALNAYWNPAFSWLLIPISYFTIWPFTGKILNIFLIGGLFISTFIFASYILHDRNKGLIAAILTTFLPGEFIYAWLYVTPDLLLTIFCLWFLMFFFFLLKTVDTTNWFIFGILTGAGYLIKNIFLPITIIFIIISLFINQKRPKLKNIVHLFLGLVIIPLVWGVLLSLKYHRLTLGTSGGVNYYQYVVKRENFNFFTKPSQYQHDGTSYWYDPSSFPKIKFSLKNQLLTLYTNFKNLARILLFNITFGCILIVLSLFSSKKIAHQKTLVIFILIWYIVYSLILVVPRYIWPTIPLWFTIIAGNFSKQSRFLYFIYFAIALVMFSRGYIRYFKSDPAHFRNWEISEILKPPCVLLSDNWINGMAVTYLSGCKYYGVTETTKMNTVYANTLSTEIRNGSVTHFLSLNSKNYQNISFLSPVYSWMVKNQNATLYKYIE